MITRFYDRRSDKGRAVIDEHLKKCFVLALPTTRGQERMYGFALEPLVTSGKIAGYSITKNSKEAFEEFFNQPNEGNNIVIVHRISDLVNKAEFEMRERILEITKRTKGFHPILVDPDALDSVNLETGEHYSIKDGIPVVIPTSHSMQPCEHNMYRLLALSGHHLKDEEDPKAA